MGLRILTVLVSLVCVVGQGLAQHPARQTTWPSSAAGCAKTCPSIGCCIDDYCRKAFPMILNVSRCGSPDDYCRKIIPCLTDVFGGCGCDDYCRKALPNLLCPPQSPYLRCGPCELNALPARR